MASGARAETPSRARLLRRTEIRRRQRAGRTSLARRRARLPIAVPRGQGNAGARRARATALRNTVAAPRATDRHVWPWDCEFSGETLDVAAQEGTG
jgi:hypothetical protein